MTHRALGWLFILICLTALTGTARARYDEPPDTGPALVYIPLPDPKNDPAEFTTALAHLERTGLPVYTLLDGDTGTYLLAGVDPVDRESLTAAGFATRVLDADITMADYYLAYPTPGRPRPNWSDYGRVLLDDGVRVLLRVYPSGAARLAEAGAELRALTLNSKPLQPAPTKMTIPTAVNRDSLIQSMMDRVDSTTIYSYTGDLSGEWPVEIGSEPYTIVTRHTYSGETIQKATQFVGDHLEGLGLNVEYHEWEAGRPPNVIGELPGSINPDDIFIISAHLDDMPSGSVAPGADDNASGSVAVLTAADILTQYQWGCTLRFALWTGEEQGLLGSEAYAQRAYDNGEHIVGVLNLDMIAWNTPSSNPDIELHARSSIPATLDLAQLFVDVIDAYDLNLIPEIKPNGSGASDHASFWDYGYTAILGIEDFNDFNPYYHTTNDLLANLDLDYYAEFVKASVGTFAHMSNCLIPRSIGYLEGYVTAASDGAAIVNATVTASAADGHAFSTLTGVTGHYSHTLPAGAYTVTASAYDYIPATVVGVAIITDTITSQDFVLETIPTYTISGTIVEAGTGGLPLLAKVTVSDTPLAPTWTDPATGFYSVTLPGGTFTLRVSAASHQPEEREIVVDHDQTQNFALQPLPCILLVDDDQNSPADFDWSPSRPTEGDDVSFSASVAFGSPPIAYAWDFGDGETAVGAQVTHVFTPAAAYTVWMTATNCDGDGTSVVSHTLDVAAIAPCEQVGGADFDWSPSEPLIGEGVSFTGTVASGDLPIDYAWDFGDGAMATGARATHVFTSSGAHTVWMTATNCSGDGVAIISRTLTVAATPICTEVTGVALSVVTTGTLHAGDKATFSADIAPDDAATPYTYTVSVDDGIIVAPQAGDDDPLTFSHTFVSGGDHFVEVAVWNCAMTGPARDRLELEVLTVQFVYLPIVLK